MKEPTLEPDIQRISWGPQHPMSGQTRILLDTDGEKIHKIVADDLLKAGNLVVDTFKIFSNVTDVYPINNYYNGHWSDDAHGQLAKSCELYLDKFFE